MIPNILMLGCNWVPKPYPGNCDAAQLEAFAEWGPNANTSVATELLRPGTTRGGFVTACIVHAQSMYMCNGEGAHRWDALPIRGTILQEAFGNFFFDRAGPRLLFDYVAYPGN